MEAGILLGDTRGCLLDVLGDQEVEPPPSALNLSVGKMEGRVRDPCNCSLFPRPLPQPLKPHSSFLAP